MSRNYLIDLWSIHARSIPALCHPHGSLTRFAYVSVGLSHHTYHRPRRLAGLCPRHRSIRFPRFDRPSRIDAPNLAPQPRDPSSGQPRESQIPHKARSAIGQWAQQSCGTPWAWVLGCLGAWGTAGPPSARASLSGSGSVVREAYHRKGAGRQHLLPGNRVCWVSS